MGRLPSGCSARPASTAVRRVRRLAKHVRWPAAPHPRAPRFRFRLVDVQNDRYDPDGAVTGDAVRFPVRSAAFDMACLFSVFTHFDPDDIATYLHELARVLRPVASWWRPGPVGRGAATDAENGTFPMVHQRDDGVLHADEKDPLWAIAHHLDRVRAIVADAGLEVERIDLGTWAGGPGPSRHDVVVLRSRPRGLSRGRPGSVVRALQLDQPGPGLGELVGQPGGGLLGGGPGGDRVGRGPLGLDPALDRGAELLLVLLGGHLQVAQRLGRAPLGGRPLAAGADRGLGLHRGLVLGRLPGLLGGSRGLLGLGPGGLRLAGGLRLGGARLLGGEPRLVGPLGELGLLDRHLVRSLLGLGGARGRGELLGGTPLRLLAQARGVLGGG